MIRREAGRIVVSGPVTLANVAELLEEGRQHLAEGVRSVDLGEVTELDSALLAALLAWLRDARAAKRELAFANLPEGSCRRCRASTAWKASPADREPPPPERDRSPRRREALRRVARAVGR